jgi:hypothetical protein
MFIKINTSSLVKLSVQSFTVFSEKYPSLISQWAIPIGVNSFSMLEGKIFTNLSPLFLYQILCNSEIAGKRLVENQYCVGSLPVNSGLGQGVGFDSLQIKDKTLSFKYLI